MTAAAMGDATSKRKVTVARLTTRDVPGSVSSRPSSRNGTHPTSRPVSPTKSAVSTTSPLIRPKARVNQSALRRTSSSHTDSPINPSRPPSPVKSVVSPVSRVRSPPTSTIGIGSTRKSTTARVKASASVTSDASFKAKSPSPEPRNRPSTASTDTFKTHSVLRDSPATILHHASSFSSLQPRSPSPPTPNTLTRTPGFRLAQSELGISSPSTENHTDNGNFVLQPIKIRSRVSAMAKNVTESAELSPSISSTRSVPSRVRVPSISSIASFVSTPSNKSGSPASSGSTPIITYPITTASPAANPHRYPSSRPTPSPGSGLRSSFSSSPSPKYTSMSPESRPQSDEFRPFSRTTTTSVFPPSPKSNGFSRRPSVGGGNIARIVDDPVNVPLPPQSPPTSSLSVSSRSSTSYVPEPGTSPDSPVSFSFNVTSPKRHSLKDTLETLNAYVSARDGGSGSGSRVQEEEEEEETNSLSGLTVEEDEERKVKAEAKSNRKIADLEITNRSLLAINASLEKTKDRQAKEIRELKRKLRESRLILPPRAYRAVKSSLNPEEIGDDEEDIESSSSGDDDNDDDDGGGGGGDDDNESVVVDNATARKGSSDETYQRIKLLINNLLTSGKQALEDTKENHMETKGGTKVLTAEEVETWRDATGTGLSADHLSDQGSHFEVADRGLDDFDEDDGYSTGRPRSHSPTPQPATSNGSNAIHRDRTNSIARSSSLSSPQLPPILITEPS